ncbi:metal ABC transporter ATP-binding protein [Mangrovibacillus cuniculi]|uniref:Metal ABC transporter ATP-binding protein n=1 Tax=Mangrovibacillus cuniculi TaxID=2593652 RepID=A0A7S8CBG0_9BACI|nr:metal ABC transporter ATP-binding protein [Mangrovibacillus cuniculi]QPC46900.1 metal ABC transporter ATP-binding protein [Mangrovibacillus cuniculi]
MPSPILELKDVYFRYERDWVLEHIDLTINQGQFWALVGPNGSGKSTMLKIILGLLTPQKGTVKWFGNDRKEFKHWEKIGYVSQKANSFNTGFPATVYEVVASGLVKKAGLFQRIGKKYRKDILDAISAVGMSDFLQRNIGELSGGQQQRVFIARAIVSKPEVLILDEPTVGIDHQHVQAFYQMLEQLNKESGMTLLLVTHDMGAVSTRVSHVACLHKHLHFHGTSNDFEQLDQGDLSGVYGHEVQLLQHEHVHEEELQR